MKPIFSRATGRKNRCAFACSAIFAVICVFFGAIIASAQGPGANANTSSHESERATQVRALNNSVLQLHGQVQENSSSAPEIRSLAAIALTQRAAALLTLIREEPMTALTFAYSPELLADLAAKFPDSQSLLESHSIISGPIELWVFDSADRKTSQSRYQMKSGGQVLTLHFAAQPPKSLKGVMFQVTGVIAGKEMAVSEARPTQLMADATPAPGMGMDLSKFMVSGLPEFSALGMHLLLCGTLIVMLKFLAGTLDSARRNKQLSIFAVLLGILLLNPAVSSAQVSSCSTTGVQNIAVLLVNFPTANLPAGVSTQSLSDIFFNTSTGVSVDGFLRDASYGQTSATGNVFGPYTLTGTYTTCGDVSGAVLNDVVAAAVSGGVNLQNYSRIFLVFPDVLSCGWAGFASVGTCSFASTSGTFNASVAYLSASYATTRSVGVEVASHEIGHNFGLLHSGTISPAIATDVLGPLTSSGTQADVGDYWSVLGTPTLGLYPAPQKAEVLNWLSPGSNYEVVQSGGTYTLQPLETSPAGLQALKVQRGTGNNEWLWIEYRQPTGNYDSTLLGPEAFSGALIHYEDTNTALGHTYLANFKPSDTTGHSPALAAGQTWNDPYSNVSISAPSATSSGLTVSVAYGASSCVSSPPTVSFTPLNPSIYPNQSANYSVTVTNNDSSACSSSTISLASTEPSGWSTVLSSPSVALSPSQSASLQMSKGAPSGTPAGTYAVNLSASNNSASGIGTANATVVTPPSLAVTLSVSGVSFTPPGTVAISASVTNGGTSVSGASVAFMLILPTGVTVTQTASTASNGTATWNYKLNQKSPAGMYSVTARAALSSGSRKTASTQTVPSNSATFNVQ